MSLVVLFLAALLWVAVHVGISGIPAYRARAVAKLGGEKPFMIAFTVASIVSLVLMVLAYNAADRVVLYDTPAALRILPRFVADPTALQVGQGAPLNVLRMVFDPRLARPFILDWPSVARDLAGRVHRELLAHPDDRALRELLASVFDAPDVPPELRQPDLGAPSAPILAIRLRRDDLELGFFTTITTFNAPQNVTLEELRIESYFPLDDETARVCAALASAG